MPAVVSGKSDRGRDLLNVIVSIGKIGAVNPLPGIRLQVRYNGAVGLINPIDRAGKVAAGIAVLLDKSYTPLFEAVCELNGCGPAGKHNNVVAVLSMPFPVIRNVRSETIPSSECFRIFRSPADSV